MRLVERVHSFQVTVGSSYTHGVECSAVAAAQQLPQPVDVSDPSCLNDGIFGRHEERVNLFEDMGQRQDSVREARVLEASERLQARVAWEQPLGAEVVALLLGAHSLGAGGGGLRGALVSA